MDNRKKTDRSNQHLKFDLLPALERSGLTRHAFAEKAGLNYTSVSDLANSKYKRIGIDTLEKICKALNCDVADLFVWE